MGTGWLRCCCLLGVVQGQGRLWERRLRLFGLLCGLLCSLLLVVAAFAMVALGSVLPYSTNQGWIVCMGTRTEEVVTRLKSGRLF